MKKRKNRKNKVYHDEVCTTTGKLMFFTEDEARTAILNIKYKYKDNIERDYYKCNNCGTYHITSHGQFKRKILSIEVEKMLSVLNTCPKTTQYMFLEEKDAVTYIRYILKEKNNTCTSNNVKLYKCNFCNTYHVEEEGKSIYEENT